MIPSPGAHGGDGERVARALGIDVLDLSASLNPAAPDPRPVLARHLDAVGRYPDPSRATAALADAIGVDRSRLLLTNGGAEAIALVSSELGGHVDEPEFGLLPRDNAGPRWRSNPNNPTGRLAEAAEMAGVWDEAFYPLATGQWTRGDPGVVVVGSLTKLFACPGLRLGYILADDIEPFARRQPHWSVGGVAAAAIPDFLATADLAAWAARIAALRDQLRALLSPFAPQPADANWLLCADAAGLRDRLAPHGVLVRDCASFGLPGYARVAVPDEAGLERLEAALRRLG
ncbi:MAG: aminotransferase class I/II-fold pyridoxal phosphate-dependent enzyme [Actinobacteria bacterium]|nr:aminotransferase class I/II-fold pyridoxal phosphate-dependent enzyme [Actinomycetota bacterium]